MLSGNARRHHAAADHRIAKSLLTGKLFDVAGEPMSPTFSRGKSGRSYRYYVSASLQQGATTSEHAVVRRLSAQAIERVVTEVAERLLATEERAVDQVISVRLVSDGLVIDFPGGRASDLSFRLSDEEKIVHAASKVVRIHVPLALPLRGGRPLVLTGATRSAKPDPTLIAALRRAHRMLEREGGMPIVQSSPLSLYDRKILRLAFLAPELQRDILAGRQPPLLSLEKLKLIDIPLAWNEQKAALGWPSE